MQKTESPNIYLFNPTCEYAVANGHASWQPNRLLQKMEADLATLPLYFAKETDIVIVPQLPSADFQKRLGKLGIKVPHFKTLKELNENPPENIHELRPWGWSPAAHKRLETLKKYCSVRSQKSPVFQWQNSYKELYSKTFAREILHQLVIQFPSEHYLEENMLTEVCTSRETYEQLIQKWGKLMVKAPWSSSGRGLQPVRYTPIHPKVWDKLLGIIKEQGKAIVEPYLDKIIDLAFQFELRNKKVSFIGISNFTTDYKGQYNGNSLNGLPDSLNTDVKSFINQLPEIILPPLMTILDSSKLAENYEGFFGVDTLIFKDKKDRLKVNPCLEINVRQNMGLLSLYLEKFINKETKGKFRTYYNPNVGFKDFCSAMQTKYPLCITNKNIDAGFFPLTDIQNNSQFGAYLLV